VSSKYTSPYVEFEPTVQVDADPTSVPDDHLTMTPEDSIFSHHNEPNFIQVITGYIFITAYN
jgi:hypothetical protein